MSHFHYLLAAILLCGALSGCERYVDKETEPDEPLSSFTSSAETLAGTSHAADNAGNG